MVFCFTHIDLDPSVLYTYSCRHSLNFLRSLFCEDNTSARVAIITIYLGLHGMHCLLMSYDAAMTKILMNYLMKEPCTKIKLIMCKNCYFSSVSRWGWIILVMIKTGFRPVCYNTTVHPIYSWPLARERVHEVLHNHPPLPTIRSLNGSEFVKHACARLVSRII